MKNIMLVDDEQHILDALSVHVNWAGMHVEVVATARKGEEALEMFYKLQPDIVMTDVYMPVMNGLELVNKIRQTHPEVPIILLSGYEDFESARLAIKWEVNHFLLKPVSVEEIEEIVREIVLELEIKEKKKSIDDNYQSNLTQMLPGLRKNFISTLISMRFRESEITQDRLDFLGIVNPRIVLAISLRIERPQFLSRIDERDWQLVRYGAINIVEELLKEEWSSQNSCQGEMVDYSDDLLIIALFSSAVEMENVQQSAAALSRKMAQKILFFMSIDAKAGVGTAKPGLHHLIDSYLESVKALELADFQSTEHVFLYLNEKTEVRHFTFPQEGLKLFSDALFQKDYLRAIECWKAILQMTEGQEFSQLGMQPLCIGVFSLLSNAWYDVFPETPIPYEMSRFFEGMQYSYKRKETMRWINQVVEFWLDKFTQEWGGKKRHQLVDQVKHYVEENYHEEIVFEELAKTLYVHPKYLSQLFKRVTGENFIAYLNRSRVEKAIELMQPQTNLVYEISEMVGFKNTSYFSKVFKSVTGKNPSYYMQIHE